MGEHFLRVPKTRFIAGWSDAQHDPPQRLKQLSHRLAQASLPPATLLGIDEALPFGEQQARLQTLLPDLARRLELTTGEKVTVGDLIAIIRYESLQKARRQR